MLEEPFKTLKEEWERLATVTKDWLTQLTKKYSAGKATDPTVVAAKGSMTTMSTMLTGTDQLLREAKTDTFADKRDFASKVKMYLDLTGQSHQELTKLSEGDDAVVQYAADVQKARDAVLEQVKLVQEATLVHELSPTRPLTTLSDSIAAPGAAYVEGSVAAYPPGTTHGGSSSSSQYSGGTAYAPGALYGGGVATHASSSAYGDGGGTGGTGSYPGVGTYAPPQKPDNLFVCVLKQFFPADSPVIRETEKLFNRGHLTLSDRQINQLTKSWDKVVAFVTDPSTNPKIHLSDCLNKSATTNATEADLLTLHDLLEQLYDRLESNVTRSDEDIFGLE